MVIMIEQVNRGRRHYHQHMEVEEELPGHQWIHIWIAHCRLFPWMPGLKRKCRLRCKVKFKRKLKLTLNLLISIVTYLFLRLREKLSWNMGTTPLRLYQHYVQRYIRVPIQLQQSPCHQIQRRQQP